MRKRPQPKRSKGGIIYKAIHKINGKIYIGLTTKTLEGRIKSHRQSITSKSRTSTTCHFLNALRAEKAGVEAFAWEQIDAASTLSKLKRKEIHWIAKCNSRDHSLGYNITKGGDHREFTDEMKKRMTEINGVKIFCHQNCQIYESIAAAARALRTDEGIIGKVTSGKLRHIRGYTFEKLVPGKDYNGIQPAPFVKIKYAQSKAVYCHQTCEIYESASMAGKKLGLSKGARLMVCKHIKGHGFSVEGYTFEEVSSGETYPKPPRPKLPKQSRNRKAVRCITTGQEFPSIGIAAKSLEVDPNFVSQILKGERKSTKGLVFEYVVEGKEPSPQQAPVPHYEVYCFQTQCIYTDVRKAGQALNLLTRNVQAQLARDLRHVKGYTFEYVEDYSLYPKPIEPLCDTSVQRFKRPVICDNTGERFESMKDATRKFNLSRDGVWGVLNGRYKYTGDHLTFSYAN